MKVSSTANPRSLDMATLHTPTRSREAGSGLARGIGAQIAALLMAVLVTAPPHAARDAAASASAPPPVRSATPDPRA
jgi:hypothetical protein